MVYLEVFTGITLSDIIAMMDVYFMILNAPAIDHGT